MSCEKVLNCRFKRPNASYRLICFPWAGGGSSFYAGWGKLMSDNIEVVGITLSGRESRFSDPCCSDFEETMEEITSAIITHCMDKELIFWGHSMGGLLAYETACRLKTSTGKEPKKLFLSGVSAPHSPMRKRFNVNSSMTNAKFIDYLRRLGGTPKEVLDNGDLMKIVLPCLRADYTLLDDIKATPPSDPPPLTCPFAFFDGDGDIKHDTEAWKSLTSGEFRLTFFPGGHFYIRDTKNMETVIDAIGRDFSEEEEII